MNSRILQVVAVFLASATLLPAGMQTRRQLVAKNKTAPPAEMMRMPWVAPLFVEDQDFTSTLVLVNSTAVNGTAEVTLRDVRGAIITTQNVRVQARSDLRLPIEPLLRRAHAADTNGSITVMPTSGNVAAQLSLTYRTEPIASFIDEEFSMPMPDSSPTLRAVVENTHGTPLIAITSTASIAQRLSIACLPKTGKRAQKVIEVAANATILTTACTNAPPLKEGADIRGGAADNNNDALGIELTSDGPAGGFAAFGLAPHRAGNAQYFSAITFVDPMMIHSPTAIYTGVPVGSTTLLSAGTYTPTVALANFGSNDAHVEVFVATTNHSVQKTALTTVVVPAGHSVMSDVSVNNASPELQNSFILTADTPPGTLITKLFSRGDQTLREVELLAKDQQDPMNGGHHPWSLQDGTNATLFLFDHRDDAQDVEVLIGYSGGLWQKTYHLQPQETQSISIRDLIQRQVPDADGHVLPATMSDGAISWSARHKSVTGRLLLSSTATSMARSFSCGIYQYLGEPVNVNGLNYNVNVGSAVNIGPAKGRLLESNSYDCDPAGDDSGQFRGPYVIYSWSDDGPYYNLYQLDTTESSYYPQGTGAGVENVSVALQDTDSGHGQCVAYGGVTVTVKPTISGGTAVWYFGGQSQSNYTTQLALTASSGSSYSWSITAGSGKASLSSSGSSATITGTAKSALNEVGVSVTVNGVSSSTHSLTVYVPDSFSYAGTDYLTDSTYAYFTKIHYQIVDQFGDVLPSAVDFNEHFTASPTPDYSGEDWRRGPESPTAGANPTDVWDGIQGETSDRTPTPTATCSPTVCTTKVYHWPGGFWVGSTTAGSGYQAKSLTWQKYTDHAEHQ
jgi:hypothetical protein